MTPPGRSISSASRLRARRQRRCSKCSRASAPTRRRMPRRCSDGASRPPAARWIEPSSPAIGRRRFRLDRARAVRPLLREGRRGAGRHAQGRSPCTGRCAAARPSSSTSRRASRRRMPTAFTRVFTAPPAYAWTVDAFRMTAAALAGRAPEAAPALARHLEGFKALALGQHWVAGRDLEFSAPLAVEPPFALPGTPWVLFGPPAEIAGLAAGRLARPRRRARASTGPGASRRSVRAAALAVRRAGRRRDRAEPVSARRGGAGSPGRRRRPSRRASGTTPKGGSWCCARSRDRSPCARRPGPSSAKWCA